MEDEIRWMDPRSIKYTQACISHEFRRKLLKRGGEPGGEAASSYAEVVSNTQPLGLKATVQHLKDGKLKVTDFPTIRVVSHLDSWYSLDNRRLWVFKEFGAQIPVEVKVADKEFFQKLSRDGDGYSVTFITSDDAREYKKNRTFLSEALKWSISDVMNEKLLVQKVEHIPMRFASSEKYLDAFKNPLLEETRAQLQRAFEEIRLASYIALKSIEEKKSEADLELHHLRTVSLLRHKSIVIRGKRGRPPWNPKPTDLILVSNVVPENVHEELERPGVQYMLGVLKDSREDDDNVLSAILFAPTESPEYKNLLDGKCNWFAMQMCNVATGMRIWDALNRRLPTEDDSLQQHYLPLLESLYVDSTVDGEFSKSDEADLPKSKHILPKEGIKGYCKYRRLNESQAIAVQTSVFALLQRQKPSIRLIQGPPGTGKTATLATLLSIFSCLKQRTLVTAPTNVAISEVVLRFLELFNSPGESNLQFGHYCEIYDTKVEHVNIQLGDIVLIGNHDRLDIDGPLGQLFLDHRIKRIINALSPVSGWRSSAIAIRDFLRSPESQHEEYKKSHEDNAGGATFVEFLKQRIKALAENFLNVCQTLATDLPSKFIRKPLLDSCSNRVNKFVRLLSQPDFKEAKARKWFEEFPGSFSEHSTATMSNFGKVVDELQSALANLLTGSWLSAPSTPTKEWVLEHAWLVFSTVSSAGRPILLRSKSFECVIVDEAAQCVEAETVILTNRSRVKQLILVGDHMQLPATVLSQVAQRCGYGRSLFERLQSLQHPINLLNIQYRMHPAISMFPNMQFYGGKVKDGHNVVTVNYDNKPFQVELFGPYTFIDVHDGSEERDEDGSKSWKNHVEVEIVVHLISKTLAVCNEAKVPSIGVISPYQSQVQNLERRLGRFLANGSVEVKSVDGFQGREKDIIIFSTVRSNQAGNIGFLSDHRRLNVAITRARYCMWIVGNTRTLTSKDAVWGAMIENAKQRKCLIDPGVDAEMTKIIRRVKEELNQLAELLNPNSVLFNGTLWKLLFAKDLKTTITQLKSTQTRHLLVNAMLNLARGRRSPYPTHTELASARYRKLIQVQPVADLWLVWTVDIELGHTPKQILKVWDAVQNSDLAKLVRRLEEGLSTCTDTYLDRCAKKQHDTSKKKLVVPAKWKEDDSFVKYKSLERKDKSITAVPRKGLDGAGMEALLEKSGVDDSVLLMKFYSLSSGIARQLLTASDGSQLAMPFEVNEQEAAIIQYSRSSFIIGRSGTGKTTVITAKLLQREQKFWIATNGISGGHGDITAINSVAKDAEILRQALITLSPKLCAAVKHNISKTRRSMQEAESGVTDNESSEVYEEIMLDDEAEAKLMGSIPDSFRNIKRNCYPLVITFRKFLSMMDGSISRPFFSSSARVSEQDLVVTMEENTDVEGNQEPRDSSPMDLAENPPHGKLRIDRNKKAGDFSDIDEQTLSEDEDWGEASEDDDIVDKDKSSGKRQVLERLTEVDFDRFVSTYWPHFNSKFTKKLDPSLVYTEVMSHIKGSLEALHSPSGVLSRKNYVAIAEWRNSPYTEEQRDDIYSLFEQYEKRKRERWEYDVADLVTHIHRTLESDGFLGERMQFVYVDEVQDFTQAQIALFKFICNNLEGGFVFAGDTAQTIARGVGFRFEDVRRLYYKEFLGNKESTPSTQASSDGTGNGHTKVPDLFQLSMNFRTHMGVVGIADSVVKLLHYFFPYAIDKLDPESSLLQGDIPVFLKTQENRGLVTSLFDMGGAAGGGDCEFGAEQVILVRDSETKHQMTNQLGQRGLVLTIHECKGLEFQDVLLYNFFAGSPLKNKWRVIYGFMDEQSSGAGQNMTFPNFDVKRHNLLCSELKQLYVVLTRARQRLWIYDECVEQHKPMLDYWCASGLVQVKQLDANLAEELQGKSSAEDWRTRGVKMFRELHYDAAKLCFDRAGDTDNAQHAKAAGLQQAAEKLQCTNQKESTRLLRQAAELFLVLRKGNAAAKCYIKIGDLKKAGSIYQNVCNPPNLEAAGDCFSEAKLWQEAARAYSGISMSKYLGTCLRGKLFDLGVSFIQAWETSSRYKSDSEPLADEISDDIYPSKISRMQGVQVDASKEKLEFEGAKVDFLTKAAGHYHQGKHTAEMMKFVLLLPSLAMRRTFLKRRDYYDQLQLIEEASGNYGKAAELAEASGDLEHAAELLERAGSIKMAVEKLLHFASIEILWKDGNKGWPRCLTPDVMQVLDKAKALVDRGDPGVGAAHIHEINILQSVGCSEIDICKENWEQARKLKGVRLQVLSGYLLVQEIVRRMLHIYEEVKDVQRSASLLRDQLPDLMEVWDQWSMHIVSLIHAVERLQKGRTRVEDEQILECVYSYLGVTRHSQPQSLLVEKSNAYWLLNSYSYSSVKNKKPGQISVAEFVPLASQFFSTQLLEVGVSTVLSAFSKYYVRLSVPDYTLGEKDDLKLTTSVLTHVLLYSCNIIRIVRDTRVTWDEETRVELNQMSQYFSRPLYDLLFICMPMESMKEIWITRDLPDASLVFERLAVDLSQKELAIPGQALIHTKFKPVDYDELGRLVTLHPFLGREWALGNAFYETRNVVRADEYKCRLWVASRNQHGAIFKSTEITMKMHHCSFWSENLFSYMLALDAIFTQVDFNEVGYMSPVVFLAVFERGVIAACAHSTHLKSMIIPQSMALCYMASQHHASYYSMVLNCACDEGCKRLEDVLHIAVDLILHLLFEVPELECWFQRFKLEKEAYLPGVILRLLKLLITICINTPYESIHRNVIQSLTRLFEMQSPVLNDLPSQFCEELQKIFITKAKMTPSLTNLVTAFSFGLCSISDPLIVLKNNARDCSVMSWHTLAAKSLRVVKVEVQLEKHGPSNFSLATLGPELVMNSSKSALNMAISEGTVRVPSVEESSSLTEDDSGSPSIVERADEEDEGVLDSEVLANDLEERSPDSPSKDTAETTWPLELEKKTVDEQDYAGGTIAPSSMTSDRVTLDDGTTLSRIFVKQLQRLLQSARERVQVPLTPLERYEREAHSAFKSNDIVDRCYVDLFISEACPLQVDVYERLVTLSKALEHLKSGNQKLENEDELLEKFSDHKENLEEAIEFINPKYEKHKEMDLICLQEGIKKLKELLESGRSELQGKLKKVLKAAEELDTQESHSVSKRANQDLPQDLLNKGKKEQNHKKKNKKRW